MIDFIDNIEHYLSLYHTGHLMDKLLRETMARYYVEHFGKNWNVVLSELYPEQNFDGFREHLEKTLPDEEVEYYKFKNPDSLVTKIEGLKPWFYPVIIKGIRVEPGVKDKASMSKDFLIERTKYRHKIIVDEVVKRFDFKGKSLLDVASNCGYWSSQYVKYGASELTAIEGRLEYINQGRLYWEENAFLPKENYRFIHSNVMDLEFWSTLQKHKKVDFSLCCGILYHIYDYEKLIRLIGSVTKEAILIDTRVSKSDAIQKEPGGWFFDAITETQNKQIPVYAKIVKTLDSMGFEVEKLSTDALVPKVLQGNDNYKSGRRSCLLAKRRR